MPLMSQDGASHQEKERKSDNSCFLYPDFTLLYSKKFLHYCNGSSRGWPVFVNFLKLLRLLGAWHALCRNV